MNHRKPTSHNTRAAVPALCRVAKLSNYLAKQLSGTPRTLAYRIKAEACSALILNGATRVNGVSPDGILALDILGDRPIRLHIRRSHLTAPAQTALADEMAAARVVSSLADRCGTNVFFIGRRERATTKEAR